MTRRPGFPARIPSGTPQPPAGRAAAPAPRAAATVAGPAGHGLDSQAVRTRMVQKLAAQGAIVASGLTPDDFTRHIASETTKWQKVVKDSGAKVE